MTAPQKAESIFQNGRLKPGIYKIQNLHFETYLDIHQSSKQLCCRPAKDLDVGRGLWEIKDFGVGHTIQRVEPREPDQFCTPLEGLGDGNPLHVNAYPATWRVELVNRGTHRGFEYVRFYWGPTKKTWDLDWHTGRNNGAKVQMFHDKTAEGCQTWKLIPVEGASTPPEKLAETPPSYRREPATGQPPAPTQHTESDDDDFDTIVTEVTTVTTTTRRNYRVVDA